MSNQRALLVNKEIRDFLFQINCMNGLFYLKQSRVNKKTSLPFSQRKIMGVTHRPQKHSHFVYFHLQLTFCLFDMVDMVNMYLVLNMTFSALVV